MGKGEYLEAGRPIEGSREKDDEVLCQGGSSRDGDTES